MNPQIDFNVNISLYAYGVFLKASHCFGNNTFTVGEFLQHGKEGRYKVTKAFDELVEENYFEKNGTRYKTTRETIIFEPVIIEKSSAR